MYDVTIIGSGIIGSFIAHYLSKYDLRIVMIEKDIEVSNGVTKANSGIIHSGYDPKPGSLKAKLNVLGSKMYTEITKELNVDFKRIGSYTLAFNEEEEIILKKLSQQSILNGVENYLIGKEELLVREPNINETVRLGLFAPTTGILAPWDMVYALLENAIYNGLELKTNDEVIDIIKNENGFIVKTTKGFYSTRYVINTAGLYSEKITKMVTDDPGFSMNFTRGEYYVIDRGYEDYVKSIIYPTPNNKGKGVLVVPTIHGNILLGPTSERIDDYEGNEVTREGLNYIKDKVDYMMKDAPYKGIIRTYSGVRPKTDRYDFIIEELDDVPQFIQVAGIDSPGLASAPAIGKIVEEIILSKENLVIKKDYQTVSQKHIKLSKNSIEDINYLINQNPKYGRIVCFCESITEAEIINAIKSPLGIKTVDGIKRRVRPGAGRCQGGCCQPQVVEILSRELNVNKKDILLNKDRSNILIEETKTSGGDYFE